MASKRPPPKPSRASEPKSLRSISRPGELPPVPRAPQPKFDSEPPTREKNVSAAVYQSLISVFDEMSPAARMEFVDVASLWAALDAPSRQAFVELITLFPKLWAADREQLQELAERLATKSTKNR